MKIKKQQNVSTDKAKQNKNLWLQATVTVAKLGNLCLIAQLLL